MKTTINRLIAICPLIFMLFVNPFSWSRVSGLQTQTTSTQKSGQSPEVTLPSRAAKPLYEAQLGKQVSEIEFKPASRVVTRMAISDRTYAVRISRSMRTACVRRT